jgi:hypothetical protein
VAASFVRGYEGGKTEEGKWKPRVSVELFDDEYYP